MAALTDRILAKDFDGGAMETARLGPAAAPDLLPLTSHADPEVRALAVECLARTGSPIAARALVRALPDPEVSVSLAAASGLKVLATAELAPDLLVAFDAIPDSTARDEVATLLGTLDGWAPPLLRQRVGREPDAAVRERMIVALARRGEPEARAEFARWLGEAGPRDSPRLVKHARYIAQPWLLRPLLPLLEDWTPALHLVEGAPGPPSLRVCDLAVDLVSEISGQQFAGAPKPLTSYDLAVIDEVKAFLAAIPAPPAAPSP